MKQGHTFIYSSIHCIHLFIAEIWNFFIYSLHSTIFIHLFNYSIDQYVHMMENAICRHTLPRCGGGGALPTYITIYLFHFIHLLDRSKEGFWRTSVCRRWRFWCTCGRAAVVGEEAGVEVATEETGSSGVDGDGGERWSREWRGLRGFWDRKWNDNGQATIYKFKNISSCS
jgi:hypothetical protein